MDRILQVWATAFAFDAGRYVLAAGAAFLFFWVWGRARFRHRRLSRDEPRAPQMRRELWYSLSTALIFSGVGTALYYGARAGVFRVYDHLGDHGASYFTFTVVLLPVLHDTYFYWTHRAMHARAIFKHVHRVHHLSRNPSPWAAYAFAPAEALIQAAYVPLIALVVPVHQIALFVFLGFMIVRNVIGHLGIEIYPSGFARRQAWLGTTTTTHHHMHHDRVKGNYGLYFTWWDRWMGTMHADYEDVQDEVASRILLP